MRFDFEVGSHQEKRKNRLVQAAIFLAEIVVVIALAFAITHFGFQKIKMHGESMSPTLVENDEIMVNKMIYRLKSPKRGDVVVFKQSGQEHSYYNVKRIIGLPGETVQIKDGLVYINGNEYTEVVNTELITNSGLAASPYTLEDGEYFVLGDNRNSSVDSRFASFGTIVKDDIIGKAWIRMNKFAFINSLNKKEKVEKSATPAVTPSPTATDAK